MISTESLAREQSRRKEVIDQNYQVVIVGGGLSGIALARRLGDKGINYCLVDSEGATRSQSVHYLTSEKAASSLGLIEEYGEQISGRLPITGYVRYDATNSGLLVLESLDPDPNRCSGFVTLSKQAIKDCAVLGGMVLYCGMSVVAVKKNSATGAWDLKFQNGQTTSTAILVDATGARTRVARLTGLVDQEMLDERKVRYCYGAVLKYDGPEDKLIFADKFPKQTDIFAQEGAGWIMPLGNRRAEVVVGWEGRLKDAGKWYIGQPLQLLQHYCDWFNRRGIEVDATSRAEVVSGVFSQQPLDYRRLGNDSDLLFFGESLGLNHPLNGYLISDIDNYAKIASKEIVGRLSGRGWNPYEAIYSQSSVLYGSQMVLSQRKTQGVISGVGRSVATAELQRLLVACMSPEGLWKAIDSGIPIKQLIAGLVSNPRYAPVVANLGIDYLSLLLRDDLYQRELWLKVKNKLHRKS